VYVHCRRGRGLSGLTFSIYRPNASIAVRRDVSTLISYLPDSYAFIFTLARENPSGHLSNSDTEVRQPAPARAKRPRPEKTNRCCFVQAGPHADGALAKLFYAQLIKAQVLDARPSCT